VLHATCPGCRTAQRMRLQAPLHVRWTCETGCGLSYDEGDVRAAQGLVRGLGLLQRQEGETALLRVALVGSAEKASGIG
jgi:hypothetical protein